MKITKGLIAYWQGPKGKDRAITRTRTTTRTIDGANGVKSAAMVVLAVGLEAVDRRRDRDVEPACADEPTPDETDDGD